MALQLFDRVQVTATANTTVSFTLGSAVGGYQSFSVLTNGSTTYYGSSDGTNWEVGIGTYSTTGPTLTRTTILSSSNSGSAVTFSGTPTVWIDYPSAKAVTSTGALTSGRVTYATTDGAVNDSANFTFNGTTVTTANDASISGLTLGKGTGTLATNTALGVSALAGSNSGTGSNTAVGYQALKSNTTGNLNSAFGYNALSAVTTGGSNVAFGNDALSAHLTGFTSTAFGARTLTASTTNQSNTAIGANALTNTTTIAATLGAITGGSGYTNGTYNAVAMTPVSGATFTTYPTVNVTVSGGAVTAVTLVTYGVGASVTTATVLTVAAALIGGTGSGFSIPVATFAVGQYNAGVGNSTLRQNTTGSGNTALGHFALLNNTTGTGNVGIGSNVVGSGNGTLGFSTLGNYNTAVGQYALSNSTTNVATLGAITSGGTGYNGGASGGPFTVQASLSSGTAVGTTGGSYPTLSITVTSGVITASTLVTNGAVFVNTNTVLTVTSAAMVTAGFAAGGSGFTVPVATLATGANNTAVGYQALNSNTTASNNTALGYQAGQTITSGTQNTLLGTNAGFSGTNNLTTGSNNTIIGYNAAASSATVSNEITIGNSSSTVLRLPFTVLVANLPAAATVGAGARSFVTNALAPSFGAAVVGGGAVSVPVYSDGTTWNVG
jgi:hypothetical protein